ncbi:MAG: hypothetical protein K6G22_13190 [Lachnospiraceae bacterium]|nr:hypothetical protein [Lachnospiraceae bacterium]
MIKSRELSIVSTGDDISEVLNEAESFAVSAGLNEKQTRRLRLLTEDTMAMLKTVTGEIDINMTFINKDDDCVIHLETETAMNLEKRENLISLSKSGKNESAKGITGKIREAFELAFLMPGSGPDAELVACASPSIAMGMPGDIGATDFMNVVYWSLSRYRDSVEDGSFDGENKDEAWDELERSVVGSLADDVKVGIRNDHVALDVYMKKA